MHILIVEDEKIIRQELTQLLENALYQVTSLDEFGDVAFFVLEVQPDLVLLDLSLPCESGFDICTKIRRKSEILPFDVQVYSEYVDDDFAAEMGASIANMILIWGSRITTAFEGYWGIRKWFWMMENI